MLGDLHTDRCDKDTYTKCAPVVRDDPEGRGELVEVVVMEWCGICGAADWEVV
jgi:hypothetical protein